MVAITAEDVQAIAVALASILGPLSLGTLATAMVWSFLMMLKGSTRAKDKLVVEADTGPGKDPKFPEGTPAWKLFDRVTTAAAEKAAKSLKMPVVPDLAPLLQTVEVEGEDGKKVTANAIVARLDELTEFVNLVQAAILVDVKDENGQPAKGLIGPNLPYLLEQAGANLQNKSKMALARDGKTPVGELDPEEQERLDRLAADPGEAAKLKTANEVLDYIEENEYLKPKTIRTLRNRLDAAFRGGQPLDNILLPYQNLLDRFAGQSIGVGGGGQPGRTGQSGGGTKLGY